VSTAARPLRGQAAWKALEQRERVVRHTAALPSLLGPFGIMGGFIQAQAHVQFVSGLVDDGLDPQAALDRPRFRVEGELVRLEQGLWDAEDDVRAAGLEPVRGTDTHLFGGGQAILIDGDALIGGSDPRKDGYAAGF
jgi:gamma-glutamyltranspeptidase/glutathione hydrolase